MLTILKQKGILLAIFLLFYVFLEILTFHIIGLTLKYVMLDIALVLFLGAFVFLIKSNKLSLVYLASLMFVFIILFITNATMIRVFDDVFSLEKLFLINEATAVFEWGFVSIKDIFLAILLYSGYILVNIIFLRFLKVKKKEAIGHYNFKRVFLFLFIVLSSALIFSFDLANTSKNIYVNGKKIDDEFYINSLKKGAFSHFGMLSFYYKEIETLLEDNLGEITTDIELIPDKTRYYGLLKGKNIITIMIESGQEIGINEYLTPNLYRIKNEGIYFSENYSINKTNVSEHIGITGNYPTFNYHYLTEDYYMPFTMPRILNDKYITSYFHDNNDKFYNRGALMEELAFENFYFHDDLFPEELPNWDGSWSFGGDYTPDSVMVERILPYLINEKESFYSFWTTLSSHGPYVNSIKSNRDFFAEKGYFEKLEEAEINGYWQNPLKGDATGEYQLNYYQAAIMDLDFAIGQILDELTNKGLLEDTLIILYGDHNVYYHELHYRINNLSSEDSYNIDLYDTILYMWNPLLNDTYENDFGTRTIDIFTSPYIIVPTVLDLLGENYSSDWYLSTSVFSDNYIPVFYSHQHTSLVDKYLYTNDGNTVLYSNNQELDDEYISNFLDNCITILDRQSKINNLYMVRESE